MAYPRNNWLDGEVPTAADLNEMANAFRIRPGALDGGNAAVTNHGDLTFAAGKGIVQDVAWQALTPNTGYTIDTTGGYWRSAASNRSRHGMTVIDAHLTKDTPSTIGTNVLIATIADTTARPYKNSIFTGWAYDAGGNLTPCRLLIQMNGGIYIGGTGSMVVQGINISCAFPRY